MKFTHYPLMLMVAERQVAMQADGTNSDPSRPYGPQPRFLDSPHPDVLEPRTICSEEALELEALPIHTTPPRRI